MILSIKRIQMKKFFSSLSFILALLVLIIPISETAAFALPTVTRQNNTGFYPTINVINHSKLYLTIPQSSGYNFVVTGYFYDSSISSPTLKYSPLNNNLNSCESQSYIFNPFNKESNLFTFPNTGWQYHYYYDSNGQCQKTIYPISASAFTNTNNFKTVFQFANSQTIESTDQRYQFTLNPTGPVVYTYDDNGCESTISIYNTQKSTSPITSGTFTLSSPVTTQYVLHGPTEYIPNPPFNWISPFSQGTTDSYIPKCDKKSFPISIEDPLIRGKLASTLNPNTNTNSSSSSSQALTCHFNFNPLNDVFCGLVTSGLLAVSGINYIIYSQLNLGTCSSGSNASSAPNKIFGSCHGNSTISNGYHQAWDQFRNIALALLVIMTLVIIIAQAIKG